MFDYQDVLIFFGFIFIASFLFFATFVNGFFTSNIFLRMMHESSNHKHEMKNIYNYLYFLINNKNADTEIQNNVTLPPQLQKQENLEYGSMGNVLTKGQSIKKYQYLVSPNKKHLLKLDFSGNLLFYTGSGDIFVWGVESKKRGKYTAKLGEDGKFALYETKNNIIEWSTKESGDKLILQDNGVLALYNGDIIVWSVSANKLK